MLSEMLQVSTYAVRDAEEYKNFCDRPSDQRPLPEEVLGVIYYIPLYLWLVFTFLALLVTRSECCRI